MTNNITVVELAVEMTIAWLENDKNRASVHDVPLVLRAMHDAIANLSTNAGGRAATRSDEEYVPMVSVKKSLADRNHIISLINGKPYKTLRRHLTDNGLTPKEYRERYGLRADYPIVSEAYREFRSAMAKKIGLGRKPDALSLAVPEPMKAKLGLRIEDSEPRESE
ncbi:MucR family transcriptional regulator [Sphingomonas echinoides]|uniref:MucR family transcriptional regulator n=1 Tax=Sphingomonas echinoides TaxID=59803 RepID=UPI002412F01D|nr:MucR family transcriptional regulator [Sphingomonas echinoides]